MLRASTTHSVGRSRLVVVDVDGLPLPPPPLPSQRELFFTTGRPAGRGPLSGISIVRDASGGFVRSVG